MSVQMIGIDHTRADLIQRERYSFTRKQAQEFMGKLVADQKVHGCILISTCNRLELYVSAPRNKEELDLFHLLKEFKHGYPNDGHLFIKRSGKQAVKHLFYLCAGLKSQIFGEDQILTQVKDALMLAREAEVTDTVMEVLFRHAVTAGKKVKTQVVMERENSSAAHLAIEKLKEAGYSFSGKQCLVIGNGMMGKVTANALREAGADVTVTIRQYRSGIVEIPEGCRQIPYGDRYEKMHDCHMVFSATASPNFTVLANEVEKLNMDSERIFLDLAVPRDIEPSVREIPGIRLYDIDDFSIDCRSDKMKEQYEESAGILEEAVEAYWSWHLSRDLVPRIQAISADAARDVGARLTKTITKILEGNQSQEELQAAITKASSSVISSMLFTLRDEMEPEIFRNCIEILQEGEG